MAEKSIYFMANGEVEGSKLMAYTISKLGSFEWNRTSMYDPQNIYDRPAGFYFRFHNNYEIYSQLDSCIRAFKGKLEWCINRSNYTRHKNYIIEPVEVYKAKESKEFKNNNNLKVALHDNYKILCEQAIEDIPFLCKHIEDWFNLKSKQPNLPTLP
ncbi:hypothetical protein [Paenibacillus glufosinatiresistens]|uniref:hypothetical protein n=1 Tax=Paenibacillus glufosinatiresistens TaxID=3070657 RepID=UPI00286EA804|nr:hypothetical protein [Paenibacillus sp. YX.27]